MRVPLASLQELRKDTCPLHGKSTCMGNHPVPLYKLKSDTLTKMRSSYTLSVRILRAAVPPNKTKAFVYQMVMYRLFLNDGDKKGLWPCPIN